MPSACRTLPGIPTLLALLALTTVGSACAGGPGTAGPPAPPPSTDAFVREGLLLPARDRAGLRETLGEPGEIRTHPMENRHDPAVTDTLVTWSYPGVEVHLHQVGNGGPEFLSAVEVTDNRYLRYPAAGVGVPRSRIHELLGPPAEGSTGGEGDTYECGTCEGAPEPVTFLYGPDGLVSSVVFSFYVD